MSNRLKHFGLYAAAAGLLAISANMAVAQTTSKAGPLAQPLAKFYTYELNIPGAPGWGQVIYDVHHPYWTGILQAIIARGNLFAAKYPAVAGSTQLNFYIFDAAKHAATPEVINMISEFYPYSDSQALIFFYNPNSPDLLASHVGAQQHVHATTATSGDGGALPTQQDIENTVDHELGHVLYGTLDAGMRELWAQNWEITIIIEEQPNHPYQYKDESGAVKTGNYYEKNPEEGFAVAFANYIAGTPQSSVITNFFDNLP